MIILEPRASLLLFGHAWNRTKHGSLRLLERGPAPELLKLESGRFLLLACFRVLAIALWRHFALS